ncbi:hypothetical protein GGD81_001306 [Rhodobium orientis]|uniref:YeeE/YedE family protein n=1 Tax=Rhodobium orientis TaxID=34017 RepID=UPI000DAD4A98|nr:YeeE/YedE family protein [Rhodobium orientis]MBB4302279.1 hypothetical protein [Rhodobium orientis]
MSLDANDFLILAAIGGLLIGLGAALAWLFSGRHYNPADCLPPLTARTFTGVPLLLLVGLALGGAFGCLAGPHGLCAAADGLRQRPGLALAGGVLGGAGLRLLHGCLVDHSVCGLARQSGRSTAVAAVFFSVAFFAGVIALEMGQ